MPSNALMRFHAERIALDFMRSDDRIDWSAWTVEIYDAKGWMLMSKAFTEVRDDRPCMTFDR